MQKQLVEPRIWIEYQRIDLDSDNFSRQSFADAIHRYGLIPDDCIVRTRKDTETHETIWEYLM